jgi:hypothetical protein
MHAGYYQCEIAWHRIYVGFPHITPMVTHSSVTRQTGIYPGGKMVGKWGVPVPMNAASNARRASQRYFLQCAINPGSDRGRRSVMINRKIFVGYDSREDIAWQVCRHSLRRHADESLNIIPIRQDVMRELGLYTRALDSHASTEFSLTRFLTPFLAGQSGWVVFCDCDFLFTADVRTVFEGLDPSKAVYVVKHDYVPAFSVKMDGQQQTSYPCKNWSSFIIFNCDHLDVKKLTPDIVNTAQPSYLHRFEWISDPRDIGALELDWNFLVGEYEKPERVPRVIHYTNGGPWFDNWQSVDFGDLWLIEKVLYEQSLERDMPPARNAAAG